MTRGRKPLLLLTLADAQRAGEPISGDEIAVVKQLHRPRGRHAARRLGRHGNTEPLEIAWPTRRRARGLHARDLPSSM